MHIMLQNPQHQYYKFHVIKKGLTDYYIPAGATESVTKTEIVMIGAVDLSD